MSSRTTRGRPAGEDNGPESSTAPPAPPTSTLDKLAELMVNLVTTVSADIERRKANEEAQQAREEARQAKEDARHESLLMAITGQSRDATPSPRQLETPQTRVEPERPREETLANEPSAAGNSAEQRISPQATQQPRDAIHGYDEQHPDPSPSDYFEKAVFDGLPPPPRNSPGNRDRFGRLLLLDPYPPKNRHLWAGQQEKGEYMDWLRILWHEVLTPGQLDATNIKNAAKPLRANLVPLKHLADPTNLSILRDIQSALEQECTPYTTWPQRVSQARLLQDEFRVVDNFVKMQKPTWPMLVEAILLQINRSSHLRAATDAFVAFRSGPRHGEPTHVFLRRMSDAYTRMTTRDRCSPEAAETIRFTLQNHAPSVMDNLRRDNALYPIHYALESAPSYAEREAHQRAVSAAKPEDSAIPAPFSDPLRPAPDDTQSTPLASNSDPVAAVNAATATTQCYNCDGFGHFASDCRKPAKAARQPRAAAAARQLRGTFEAQITSSDASRRGATSETRAQPRAKKPNRVPKSQPPGKGRGKPAAAARANAAAAKGESSSDDEDEDADGVAIYDPHMYRTDDEIDFDDYSSGREHRG